MYATLIRQSTCQCRHMREMCRFNRNLQTIFTKLCIDILHVKLFSEERNSIMDVASSQIDANHVKDDVAEK